MYTSGILWKTGDLRMVLDISPCKQQRQQQQQQQTTTTNKQTNKQTKTWQEKDIEKTFSYKKHNTIKMQIATESSTTKTRKTRNQNIWGCKQDKIEWEHEDDARRRCTKTMHKHEDQGSKLKGQTLITSKPRIKTKLKDGEVTRTNPGAIKVLIDTTIFTAAWVLLVFLVQTLFRFWCDSRTMWKKEKRKEKTNGLATHLCWYLFQ